MTSPDIDKLAPEHRRAILRFLRGGWLRTIIRVLGVTVLGAVVAAASAALTMSTQVLFRVNDLPPLLLVCIFCGAFCAWLAGRVDQHIERRVLRAFLRKHYERGRINVCMSCRYNLHGSVSHTCPECGRRVMVIDTSETDNENSSAN